MPILNQGHDARIRDRCAFQRCVGQRVPLLSYGCHVLIRALVSQTIGQRVTLLSRGRDAFIRDHCAGQQAVGQQVPMLMYGCHALIRDLCVGQQDVGQ